VHWLATDSFYLEEAFQRIHFYEPPYYGMYFEPWLWYDGDQHGGFDFYMWEAMITARMNEPAPVTIRFWGDYTPTDGSGTAYVQFRNDSTTTISGNAIIVITEDSLFYPAPNGQDWHCHVPRDYLPDPAGSAISIPAGDSAVVSQAFTIDAAWNENYCTIVAWIQDDQMQADSTYEIWQGGMVPVTELGIDEYEVHEAVAPAIICQPNPGSGRISFTYALPAGTPYTVTIYSVTGQVVTQLEGTASTESGYEIWYCNDAQGTPVASGVYLYTFTSSTVRATGKVVVR
jgi:hypothetical protein